jgi:LysM repeat protein
MAQLSHFSSYLRSPIRRRVHNNLRIEPSNKDLAPDTGANHTVVRATYTAKKLFLAEIAPVALLFIVPLFAHAGFFTAIAGLLTNAPQTTPNTHEVSIDDMELLRAATNHDPNPAKGGGDVMVEDGALVADTGPLGGEDAVKAKETNGEISVYIVRDGDSLSEVAQMFGVSVNTILWANSLTKATAIKEGDELIILPITGVRHVVKQGDTMKSIAEKYKGNAEDILAYNQLESAEAIKVGDTVVIPGGEVEPPKEPKKAVAKAGVKGGAVVSAGRGYFTHPVPGAVRTQGIHGYNGVDLGAPAGTPVRAAAAGQVIISKATGWNGGYGQYIVVKHGNGSQTLYAHLSSNSVAAGATVAQGQLIGAVGNTGKSTGNHVHFEVRGAKNPF